MPATSKPCLRGQTRKTILACSALALALGALSVAPSAFAQTQIWNGVTDDWGTASNWDGNDVPDTTSEIASFAGNGSTSVTIGAGNYSIDSLVFSGYLETGYIIDGTGTLTLNGANGISASTDADADALLTTIAPAIVLANNVTVDLAYNQIFHAVYLNGVVSETGGSRTLTKSGDGTLYLTANNTYTGLTTVNMGSLVLGNGGTTGSLAGDVNINVESTIRFNRSNDVTYGGNISGQGGITKSGAGTLTLTGTNTATGDLTIEEGNVKLDSADSLSTMRAICNVDNALDFNGFTDVTLGHLSGSGDLSLGNTNLTVGNDVNYGAGGTYSGVLSGTGTLTKIGSGGLSFASKQLYTGLTTVSEGGLVFSTSDSNLSGDLKIESGATVSFVFGTNFVGNITGAGNIQKIGTATLILPNLHTTGSVAVSGGSFKLSSTDNLANNTVDVSGTNRINFNSFPNATFGGLSGTGNQALGSTNLTVGGNNASTSYGGVLSGTGSLTKAGTGTLALTATSTYGGGTTVSAGTLSIGNGGTTGSIVGNVSVTSGANLTFNRSNDLTYAGTISGDGAVTKAGAGTLTLSGNNTYTGVTTVSAGILKVTGTSQTSGYVVGSGASLQTGSGSLALGNNQTLGGTGTITSNVQLAGGTVAPGNSPGTLSITGNFAMSSGTYTIEVASLASYDVLNITGAADFTGGTFSVTSLNGFTPSFGDFFDVVVASGGITGTENVALPTDYTFSTVSGGTVGRLTFNGLSVVPEANTGLLALMALPLLAPLATRKRHSH